MIHVYLIAFESLYCIKYTRFFGKGDKITGSNYIIE